MKTISQAIKRLTHDTVVDSRHIIVGFKSADNIGEVNLTSFDSEETDVEYLKYNGEVIWNTSAQFDAIFGSSGSDETIRDVVRRHALPELPPLPLPVKPDDKTIRNDNGEVLLKNLGYATRRAPDKTEAVYNLADTRIEDVAPDGWTIKDEERTWYVKTAILFDASDIQRISALVVHLVPVGGTAYLQADAHCAGNVYVGMIACFDDRRVPVTLVSADIGCGLSLVPIVYDERKINDFHSMEFRTFILGCMRRALKRGKVAEEGRTECHFVKEASMFYDDIELEGWLDDMTYVLETIGINIPGTKSRESTLSFVAKYAQTLGSSGNHFMELAEDKFEDPWLVIHSGSRGLGATVHSAIAYACKATCRGHEIASGPLAIFYRKAYDVLNKFAKLNRIACAIAVLTEMGAVVNAKTLTKIMRGRRLFASAVESAAPDAVPALLSGLTHNGLKAFVNHEDKTIFFIACKGAIAVTKRASSAIVALRAGEGCIVFLLADPECPWVEMDITRAVKLMTTGYFTTTSADGVVFAGHGAGRCQSATKTENMSSFEDVVKYFMDVNVVANIAPGILGDNPKVAYKSSDEIIPHLPLNIAKNWSFLKTLVSHKEGISTKIDTIRKCADYISLIPIDDSLQMLHHDINVVRRVMDSAEADERFAASERVFASLRSKYRLLV
jgi:hypothetical protein